MNSIDEVLNKSWERKLMSEKQREERRASLGEMIKKEPIKFLGNRTNYPTRAYSEESLRDEVKEVANNDHESGRCLQMNS